MPMKNKSIKLSPGMKQFMKSLAPASADSEGQFMDVDTLPAESFQGELLKRLDIDIPEKFRYNHDAQMALPSQTNKTFVKPKNGESFIVPSGSTGLMRIQSDGTHWEDFTHAALAFDVTLTDSLAGAIAVENGIQSLFNMVKVRVGSEEWTTERNWNKMKALEFHTALDTSDFQTKQGELMGYGPLATRQAWGAATTSYLMPLGINFLAEKVFPPTKNGIEIEYILEDPNKCLESTNVNPTYTMSNVRLHYEQVDPPHYLCKHFVDPVKLHIPFLHWEHFTQTVAAGVTGGSIDIDAKKSMIRNIVVVFMPQADVNNPLVADKLHTYEPVITGLQWQVKGRSIPNQNMNGLKDIFYEYAKAQGAWNSFFGLHEQSIIYGYTEWAANPIYQLSLTAQPQGGMTLDGLNTLDQNATITAVWTGPATANIKQVDIYIQHWKEGQLFVNDCVVKRSHINQ